MKPQPFVCLIFTTYNYVCEYLHKNNYIRGIEIASEGSHAFSKVFGLCQPDLILKHKPKNSNS